MGQHTVNNMCTQREKKLEAKKKRMKKHGKSLSVIYKNVIEKRCKSKEDN